MHVDFRFNQEREMPLVAKPDAVRTAKFWDCRYRSLSGLARLRNLQVLEIFGFPDVNLNVLGELRDLRYLRILHLPKVNDLAPLGGLSRLESLGLETLPSWDPSGKVQVVESLDPIGRLPALRHIQLFGVRPLDKSLAPLERCATLVSGRFSKFPKSELKRFYDTTGLSDDWIPEPSFDSTG